MRKHADNYSVSDDDIMGMFLKQGDVHIGAEDIRFIRKYLIPSNPTSNSLSTTLGDFKEFLCSLPSTLNPRFVQMKLQVIFNALPHLFSDLIAHASFPQQLMSDQESSFSVYNRDILDAFLQSDCILTHSEVYSLALLLDRAKTAVGLDFGQSMHRIRNGQLISSLITG